MMASRKPLRTVPRAGGEMCRSWLNRRTSACTSESWHGRMTRSNAEATHC